MKTILVIIFTILSIPNLAFTQSQFIKRGETGLLFSGGVLKVKDNSTLVSQISASLGGVTDVGYSHSADPSLGSFFITLYPGKDIKERLVQPVLHLSYLKLGGKANGFSIGLGGYMKIASNEIELYPSIAATYSNLSTKDWIYASAVGATFSLDIALLNPNTRLFLSPSWTITQNGQGIGIVLGLSFNFQ